MRDFSFAPQPPRPIDTTGMHSPGSSDFMSVLAGAQNKNLQHTVSQPLLPRRGVLRFGNLEIQTPVFMPVGTRGTVKALCGSELQGMGYGLILGNAYHLNIRPGTEVLAAMGGLHGFMGWPGALLTDSGGFQVMSLAKMRKIDEEGVSFSSHIDGSKIRMTPESVVDLQLAIGSNIQMVLDECTPYPASREVAQASMLRSMRWARRARARFEELGLGPSTAQFGIVQGGMHVDLRAESVGLLGEMNFEGVAIGGLSVGEPKREMRQTLAGLAQGIDERKPRYLMGVGAPDDLIDAVLLGMDMFDCVMPTRNARNGSVFVRSAASPKGKLQIKNAKHKMENIPLDPQCSCFACQNHSRAYLRHLFISEELLVLRLLSLHNLQFLWDLMAEMRAALDNGLPVAEQFRQIRLEYTGSESVD